MCCEIGITTKHLLKIRSENLKFRFPSSPAGGSLVVWSPVSRGSEAAGAGTELTVEADQGRTVSAGAIM